MVATIPSPPATARRAVPHADAARREWRIALVAVLAIKLAFLLLDPDPRFFMGDSVTYLRTALDGVFPRDRSFTYGALIWLTAVLPGTPQRIWVASDAPFFNGRAAYHLYPNDVHFAPRDRSMPDRRWVKPGDWLLVFNRRGVEYNPRKETLRWEGGAEIPAALVLPGNSAALFQFK